MFTWNGYAQYTIETVPNNKLINNSYISDPQQILDPETALRINDICRNVEDNAGAQMAIVILNAINSENPHDFGTRLFNYWGIGQAGIDNGLLILLVMNQERVEFITGNGTEEILPDILCYDIQQKSMVPYFKDGNYSLGVANGVQECANILLKNEIFDPNKHNISTDNQQKRERESASNIQRILIKFCLYVAFPLLCIYLLILIGVHLFVKDYYKKYYALRLFDIKFFCICYPSRF